MSQKLSKRLSREEFACRCGCGFAAVDMELIDCLEEIADDIDRKYNADRTLIIIHSACRCFFHNEDVQKQTIKNYKPGSSKSKHVFAMAADFHIQINIRGMRKKIDPHEVYMMADEKWLDKYGIGKYHNFTHLDVRARKARW